MTIKVLGISCSLRNARFGRGSEKLIDSIKKIKNENDLKDFLEEQSKIRLEDFFIAGGSENQPFDKIYKELQKAKGDRGLSNSEAALTAGLWGAYKNNAMISHLSLSQHFPKSGNPINLEQLRNEILSCDALLLSGPVYFGDRSSITQAFLDFIYNDNLCSKHLKGKVYAGIAVGAKRNGGQETTLIYQMVDFTNMNMLAVGNDDETTSQYGGTAKAGDVGTLYKDDYGICTSIGTGKRIASIAKALNVGGKIKIKDKVNIQIWLLQDNKSHHGLEVFKKYASEIETQVPDVKFHIIDFTIEDVERCIACDICPTDEGHVEEYRCIIKSKNDAFVKHHKTLIDADAVLLAAYSPKLRHNIINKYQQFIERTRYIRRDDYAIGDRLTAPLVLSEIGSNQNLHIRMMTSLIRHQSVINHSLIAYENKNEVLDMKNWIQDGVNFATNAIKMTAGRLAQSDLPEKIYNPLGYEISSAKKNIDLKVEKTIDNHKVRIKNHTIERHKRIQST